LKQAIALASVPPEFERIGARVEVEWTVEGKRGRVKADVVELPFLDLERKRSCRSGAPFGRRPRWVSAERPSGTTPARTLRDRRRTGAATERRGDRGRLG